MKTLWQTHALARGFLSLRICAVLLALTGSWTIALAQSAVDVPPAAAKDTSHGTVGAPSAVAGLGRDRTRADLDGELSEGVARATRRLDGMQETLSDYMQQRAQLERDLRALHINQIKQYEDSLNEESATLLQSRMRVQQEEIFTGIRRVTEAETAAANQDILEFETRRRAAALKVMSDYESEARRKLQTEFRSAEAGMRRDAEAKVAAKRDALARDLQEQLAKFEKSYTGVTPGRNVAQKQLTAQNNTSRQTPSLTNDAQVIPIIPRATQWTVTSFDTTLRTLLTRWAGKAGWSVVWDADIDLPITTSAEFSGSFEQAVKDLLGGVDSDFSRLSVTLYGQNRVVRVEQRH